ncbi:MAG: matrixin family metalloprotease, partial [Nitrospirae bacterium]|nr:matrixin family metalloprotease [Nitrospirota bacterium]
MIEVRRSHKKNILLVLSLLIIISLFAFMQSASAYVLCGSPIQKWSSPSMTLLVNTTGGTADSGSAIQASMDTWTNVATSSFVFINGGGASGCNAGALDFQNVVCFGVIPEPGILGRTSTWYYPSTGEIVDSDTKINTNFPWATDGSPTAFDVQSVVTHEIGHSLCLDHTPIPSAVMSYAISMGQIKRTLHQDDIDGITYLYPGGAPPTQYTLTVSKSGTGSGTVSSSPSGISCGVDCSESYNSGTTVILTATPAAGSTFSG